MDNNITWRLEYNTSSLEGILDKTSEYQVEGKTSGRNNNLDIEIENVLISDLDIFNELPPEINKIQRIHSFFVCLRKSIFSQQRKDITLSKLKCISSSINSAKIEWIFSSFRISFNFESDGDDYYCTFSSIDNTMSSFCDDLKAEKYQEIADIVTAFVYARI